MDVFGTQCIRTLHLAHKMIVEIAVGVRKASSIVYKASINFIRLS